MKFGETDHNGSFTAQGIGFLYEYHSGSKGLSIARAGRKTPLLSIALDDRQSNDAFGFVRLLEKASQITALKYTSNSTINLAGTLDDQKLPGIMQGIIRLAVYAFSLEREAFDDFREIFLEDTDLRQIELKRIPGYDAQTPFYLATAETKRGNVVTSRSSTLHGALTYMADKLIQEIIIKEFEYRTDIWTQAILHISSNLALLSFIINTRFDPARKIGAKGMPIPSALADIQKTNIIQ